MWNAFVKWLFSPDTGSTDVPSGPGFRIFFLVCFALAFWWSLIYGILLLQGRA